MTTEEEQAKATESSTEATADQDANTADSSGAEPAADANAGGEESRESLLSVITDVTTEDEASGEDKPADDSSTSESEAQEASEEEDSGESDDEEGEDGESAESDEDEEEDASKPPPFHDHPRWKEMVAERDRLKHLQEPAENYQRLTEYMESNSLTPEEVAEGFQIMALMKNDPAHARQILEQKMQGLQQFDPGYIPPDLQQDVDAGAITPERAQEMARLRAQGHQANFQAQRTQQQVEREREQAQRLRQQNQGQQLANAVNQWENELQAKDADYAQKAPWVRDRLRVLLQEKGRPQDPETAVELAKQAYRDVNQRLKPLSKQNKRPSKPTPSGGSSKASKEPSSLDEAINQAIDG